MPDLNLLVVGLRSLVLVLGGVITYFAGRAYQRTGSPALRSLFVGFGFVTLGSLGGGVADQVLRVGTETALVVESGVTAVGLLVILSSLYQQQ